ncbi:MAG: hypothetical protein HFH33_08145 [Eubacterium sp.]|nr:hypothetical protein [Eubacterium sp.]
MKVRNIHEEKIMMFVFSAMLILSPALSVRAKITNDFVQSISLQRADVIVKKYRVFNGVLQYRRWNETRGYWVDKKWITMD